VSLLFTNYSKNNMALWTVPGYAVSQTGKIARRKNSPIPGSSLLLDP
jgi:hypothetical protein